MKVFKIIDTFLFGTIEEQSEYDQSEKLYYYLPISFGIAVYLFIKVTIGL